MSQEAGDKLMRARCRLMTRQPWYGHMAMCIEWKKSDMTWVEEPERRTIGMRLTSMGLIQAFYNPEWVEKTELRILYGIIEHCINHLIRLHTFRTGGRELEAWNIACVHPDEIILGKDTDMIGTLNAGMMVYGQDGKAHKVKTPMRRRHKGQMVRVKARYLLPLETTPEHPVKVVYWRLKTTKSNSAFIPKTTVKEYGEPAWIKMGEIPERMAGMRKGREGFALVVPKMVLREFDTLDIRKYAKKSNYVREHAVTNNRALITEDLAWLVGLYVAEGSQGNADETCQWSLGSAERGLINRLKAMLQGWGYAAAEYDNGRNSTKVTCCSPLFTRALTDWCGSGAHNKRIPEWILLNDNSCIIHAFLRGYFEGDGHNSTTRPRNNAFTVSRTLALQLQLLCFSNDIPVGLYKSSRKTRQINDKTLPPEVGYMLEASSHRACEIFGGPTPKRQRDFAHDAGSHYYMPITGCEWFDYDGDVCNIETAGHSYLVNNAIVHNCDMAVNGEKANPYIGYQEEDGTVILPDANMIFVPKGWPTGESAEHYYERIVKESPKPEKKKGPMKKPDPDGDPDDQGGDGDEDGDGEGQPGQGKKKPGNYKYGNHEGAALDDHETWNQSEISQDEARQLVHNMVKEATEKSQGHVPGHLKQIIEQLAKPVVRWRELLRQYLGTHVGNRRKTYSRANRRIQAFGTKGISRHAAATVSVIVDTSGSIGTKELEQFFAEIEAISYRAKVHVLQWDAEFQGYERYRRGDWKKITANGRGGTDMAAPFQWLEDNKCVGDVVVQLTDGYCNWPPERRYPTLFVITTDEKASPGPDWGVVIRMRTYE